MKVRPLNDRILVRRDASMEQTAGGLYIPEKAKEAPDRATVVAVGSGAIMDNGKVRKLEVKVGDKIMFSKYSGNEVNVGGEDFLILKECDVIGIIE